MRTTCLILLILALVSCKGKNHIPGDILSQQKMQAVLWDLMRTDQFLAEYVLNRDTSLKKETESLQYYRQVFAIHGISKDEFQRSYAFYKSRPLLFKAIMDSISKPPLADTSTAVVPQQAPKPVVPDSAAKPAPVQLPVQDTLPAKLKPAVKRKGLSLPTR